MLQVFPATLPIYVAARIAGTEKCIGQTAHPGSDPRIKDDPAGGKAGRLVWGVPDGKQIADFTALFQRPERHLNAALRRRRGAAPAFVGQIEGGRGRGPRGRQPE